jgi:hypothetical protein
MLDLYSDHLISAFGQTTGLSALLNGEISHHSVQRFLAEERKTSDDLWRTVKPSILYLHALQSAYATLRESIPLAWLCKVNV